MAGMIRPFVVEEVTVDVARVPAAQLDQLAALLEEVTEQDPASPASRMLDQLAAQLRDVLLWRLVRSDMLEAEAGR